MPALAQISSAENPLVRRLIRLATLPRVTRELKQTLAEGIHLAEVLLGAPAKVRSVILRKGAASASFDLGARLADLHAAQFIELAGHLYDRAAPVEHGAGLMALIDIPDSEESQRLTGDAIFLDGVQDPGNVGALLRTAAAAGIATVCAATGTAALWSPRALRAGMGAHWRLRLVEHIGIDEFRAVFDGTLIAADAHAGQTLYQMQWPAGAIAWLFGAEGAGLSAATSAACDLTLRIPLAAGVESLNVAAAAAICVFERRRCLESAAAPPMIGER